MGNIYLIDYSVKGIKTIDEWASFQFYKKTITKSFSIKNYNVKGIYGANGSGKSAVIASVRILKNLLLDSSYLNNPIAQKELQELINKKQGSLEIKLDFLETIEKEYWVYSYHIVLEKNTNSKFAEGWNKVGSSNVDLPDDSSIWNDPTPTDDDTTPTDEDTTTTDGDDNTPSNPDSYDSIQTPSSLICTFCNFL